MPRVQRSLLGLNQSGRSRHRAIGGNSSLTCACYGVRRPKRKIRTQPEIMETLENMLFVFLFPREKLAKLPIAMNSSAEYITNDT